MAQSSGGNTYGVAKFIVSADATQGNYTTIAAALTASSSGDTIFLRTGTYTENLTLKAGVNLVAFECDALTPNVTIIGKATFTAAGTVSISGIRLQTNSDFVLAVTGTAASIVNLENCYLNCTNNTGISFSSSDATAIISLFNCISNLGTTGIALYTSTSAGTILFESCILRNSGNSVTASTHSAAQVSLRYCNAQIVFSCSSTASFVVESSGFSSVNTTQFAITGTGSSTFEYSFMNSGNQACITIGSGASASVNFCRLTSSASNVITGAGTLISGDNSYPSSATTSVTTNTIVPASVRTSSMQPSFFAYPNADITNATGDGTLYTIIYNAELYDVGSNFNTTTGTFTAPFLGKYQFNVVTALSNIPALAVNTQHSLVSSAGNIYRFNSDVYTAGTFSAKFLTGSVIISMSAGESVTVTTLVGTTTKTATVAGLSGSTYRSFFSGFLVS